MTARREALGFERRAARRARNVGCALHVLWAAAGLSLPGGAASAQTVTVTNATPGASVEAVWNANPAGTAVVDRLGNASIPMRVLTTARTTMDAHVFVDGCGERWRVLVVQIGMAPPPLEPGCVRQEMAGVFVVRPVSTLVVGVGRPIATLLLIQGSFDPTAPPRSRTESPTGLVLFGGAGLTSQGSDAGTRSCGNVADCTRDGSGFGYSAGAAYWFIPFAAAEVTVLKLSDLSVEGAGTGHRFTSGMDTGVLTIAGVAGAPIGSMRLYAKVGAAYHRATFTTNQTIDPVTITVDEEVTLTTPGGSQTLQSRTGGWGLVVGGGLEGWATRFAGFYAELGWAQLKGSDLDGGEATLDDRAIYVMGGVRVRLGR